MWNRYCLRCGTPNFSVRLSTCFCSECVEQLRKRQAEYVEGLSQFFQQRDAEEAQRKAG